MTVIGHLEKITRALAAANGTLVIANCKDCPFVSDPSQVPCICKLSLTEMVGGGVSWRYVHGNSAPPRWCPIRKYNGVSLAVDVEPSPDQWHHG